MITCSQPTAAPESDSVSTSPSAPPERPLNRRQEKFCAHYSISGNATEAAKLAGYSERSAKNHGFRLLRDPRVDECVYRMRVNGAIKFGPVMAFARLENLFRKASEAGDFRGAAHILTLQARLAGVESWMPPSAVVQAKQREQLGLGRGALGTKGRDPFDNLDEQCDIAYGRPVGAGTENDDR